VSIDRLDVDLIELLTAEPRIGVYEASRRLGVARGTVQARPDRLQKNGVIVDFGPTIDPQALGYPVTAFVTTEVDQRHRSGALLKHLDTIPEVLEAHTITGQGDVLIRVVARSNADLQRVIDQIGQDPHVLRTSTIIALQSRVGPRIIPLLREATK
jgi:DNA-binding Lrp family transcriptional regulator